MQCLLHREDLDRSWVGAAAATAGGVVCRRSQMRSVAVARALVLGESVAACASLMDCSILNKKKE